MTAKEMKEKNQIRQKNAYFGVKNQAESLSL